MFSGLDANGFLIVILAIQLATSFPSEVALKSKMGRSSGLKRSQNISGDFERVDRSELGAIVETQEPESSWEFRDDRHCTADYCGRYSSSRYDSV